MTVDLLTSRLKAVKRELTALKTSHMRGLGRIKIYGQTLTIPTGQTGIHELDIDVTLDSSFAAFPFTQVLPAVNNAGFYTMEVDGFTYVDGYHVKYHMLWFERTNASGTNYARVVSTSPITNVTYNWTS